MENKYVLLVSIIFFIASAFMMARDFYIFHKKNKEIEKLKKENISLSLWKKKELSYLLISEMLKFTAKSNPSDLEENSVLARRRAVEDVNNINSYSYLKKYMNGYEKIVSPEMAVIHQDVIENCKKHVGELFNQELISIKEMQISSTVKLRMVDTFIKELSLLCFKNFHYYSGNLNAVKKFKVELEESLSLESSVPVVPMTTSQSSETKIAEKK